MPLLAFRGSPGPAQHPHLPASGYNSHTHSHMDTASCGHTHSDVVPQRKVAGETPKNLGFPNSALSSDQPNPGGSLVLKWLGKR